MADLKKYFFDIDFVRNNILNVKIHPISTIDRTSLGLVLSSIDQGITVYDTNDNLIYNWTGTIWKTATPDLTGYVPYTGANNDVSLGDHSFIINTPGYNTYFRVDASDGSEYTKQTRNEFYVQNNSTNSTYTNGHIIYGVSGAATDVGFLSPTSTRTINFPDNSGTVALTSDIPSVTGFVPYTGANANVDLNTHTISGYAPGGLDEKQWNIGTNSKFGAITITSDGFVSDGSLSSVISFNAEDASRRGLIYSPQFYSDNRLHFGPSNISTEKIAYLSDIPSLTGYVPYTGATTNVTLGSHDFTSHDINATDIVNVGNYINIGTFSGGILIGSPAGYIQSNDPTGATSWALGSTTGQSQWILYNQNGNDGSGTYQYGMNFNRTPGSEAFTFGKFNTYNWVKIDNTGVTSPSIFSQDFVSSGINALNSTTYTGHTKIVDVGAAIPNYTMYTDLSNIRLQVGTAAHIGFNQGGTTNSMFTVGFNFSNTSDGNLQLRSSRFQNAVSGSGGEYLEITQGQTYSDFNNHTGNGFRYLSAAGLQSVLIGQNATITLGGTSAGSSPTISLSNTGGSVRTQLYYNGTTGAVGSVGSFPFQIETNGVARLTFSAAGVGTFSTAPIIPLTGILQGNGASAISTVTTTGTGNVVLNTSPTISSPTLSGTPITATPGSLITTNQIVNGLYVSTYYAPLASPTFTGSPLAPTQTAGDNSTKIATTAYVNSATLIHPINTTSITTTTYTVLTADEVLWIDTTTNANTATLPTAVGRVGKIYTFKRISAGSNNVTIATTSSQTIDGVTTYTLSAQWKYVSVISNGTNWLIIANN